MDCGASPVNDDLRDASGGLGRRFGDLLRQHRQAAEMTQEGLAEAAGLSVDAIAALERGRRRAPRAITVRLLADALKLSDADRAALVEAARHRSDLPVRQVSRLPEQVDELVGRGVERVEVTDLFVHHATRLVTLTGPGGVGKTRLATAVAHSFVERHHKPACWLPLASVGDDAAVLRTALAGLGIQHRVDHPLDAIVDAVGDRELLLVLDNCEHVLDECATLVSTLLEQCHAAKILVTSRELLRIPGEKVYDVPPLSLPDIDCPVHELERSPAVRLFISRMVMLGRDRGHPSAELPALAEICRRLEGIPLAIELAAARTTVLSATQIATALDESFGVLGAGARTAAPRHRTLRAAIDWSHDLLTEAERHLFAQVSVFAGGWNLAAATALHPMLPEYRVLELTGQLADKSLIRARTRARQMRFDMLEVIREYAHDRLHHSGGLGPTQRRHAVYYADLVARAEPELSRATQTRWLDTLDVELDNIAAAMSWTLIARETPLAMRLAASVWKFCALRGHYSHGREWLEATLTLPGASEDERYTNVCLGAGTLAFLCCEYAVADRHVGASLDAARAMGDRTGMAAALQRRGAIARELGDYAESIRLHQESIGLWRAAGDEVGEAWAHNYLGFVAWLSTDFPEAQRQCLDALHRFRDIGDREGIAWSLISLGAVARYQGEHGTAEALLSESLDMSKEIGFREGVAWSLNHLGALLRLRGQPARARELLSDSFFEHRELGDRWRAASLLEELAATSGLAGQPGNALFLLGAAAKLREDIGAPVPECERPDRATTLRVARGMLSQPAADAAWAAGRDTPWRGAIATPPAVPRPRAAPQDHDRTPGTRERA